MDILHKILGFLNKKRTREIDRSTHLAIVWLEQFLCYFQEDLENQSSVNSLQIDTPYETDEEMKSEEAKSHKKIYLQPRLASPLLFNDDMNVS